MLTKSMSTTEIQDLKGYSSQGYDDCSTSLPWDAHPPPHPRERSPSAARVVPWWEVRQASPVRGARPFWAERRADERSTPKPRRDSRGIEGAFSSSSSDFDENELYALEQHAHGMLGHAPDVYQGHDTWASLVKPSSS